MLSIIGFRGSAGTTAPTSFKTTPASTVGMTAAMAIAMIPPMEVPITTTRCKPSTASRLRMSSR